MKKFNKGYIAAFVVAAIFIFVLLFPGGGGSFISNEYQNYSDFLSSVEQKDVESVQLNNGTIYYTLKDDETTYKTTAMNDPELVSKLEASGAEFTQVAANSTNTMFSTWLMILMPWILIWLLSWWFLRRTRRKLSNSLNESSSKNDDAAGEDSGFPFGGFGGGGFNPMGRSNAKMYKSEMTGTLFKDVAGQEEAKNSLQEVVSFLHDPSRYNAIGAKMPKGVLLVGPPGTGKTLLAKAVAGEANVPFFSVAGSEFVEMFVGRGAARVRDLFKEARKHAPCIIFIDEIDTIGKKRDGGGFNGNDEREQTLNQLLSELDGFDGAKGIVLIGATNRPDTLDPALTRPGRFDRRVPVELPDLEGRRAILELHAAHVKTESTIDYDMIARASAGTSGADLANIVNEGALLAVRDNRKKVAQKDLEEAIEIVIAGEKKKNKIMSDKERMIVAYHEIGHALVSARSKHAAPVHKITIIPRTKGALGYTMQVDEEESNLLSKDELFTRIVTYCGGRAAEDLIFKSITSGASNDIEMATKTARMMITRLGMSDSFGMMALETVSNAYLGGDSALACSEQTASRVDKEVGDLISKAYKEAYTILQDNIMKLHELAKYLYEKETITGEEFMNILDKPEPLKEIPYSA